MTDDGTPRPLPTTTGFPARRVVAALRNRDIDPAPLLQRVGLTEQDLNKPEGRVSSAAQARLLELAAEALRDRALGFHLAAEVNPRELGLVFYLASAAKDLGEALALLVRYCRIVNEAIRVQLTRRSSDLVIEVQLVGVQGFRAVQNTELAVTVVLKSLREITGRNVHPTKITLVHTRNSDSREFERFAPVRSSLAGLPFNSFSPIKPSLCLSLRRTCTCSTSFDPFAMRRPSSAKRRRGHCAPWLKTRRKSCCRTAKREGTILRRT